MYILGNGGYAAAVKFAAETMGLEYDIINRSNWNLIKDIRNTIVYNCTPVENLGEIIDDSVTFIDCIVTSITGYLPSGWSISLFRSFSTDRKKNGKKN